MRINFVRECINKRVIKLVVIPGALNVADMLSKPLPKGPFLRHRDRLLSGFGGDVKNITEDHQSGSKVLLFSAVTYDEIISMLARQDLINAEIRRLNH